MFRAIKNGLNKPIYCIEKKEGEAYFIRHEDAFRRFKTVMK